MKKFLLLLVTAFSLLISCQKDDGKAGGGNLEGKWWSYNESMGILNSIWIIVRYFPSCLFKKITGNDKVLFYFESGRCLTQSSDEGGEYSDSGNYTYDGKTLTMGGYTYDIIKLTKEELIIEANEVFNESFPRTLINNGYPITAMNGVDIYGEYPKDSFYTGWFWYIDKKGNAVPCESMDFDYDNTTQQIKGAFYDRIRVSFNAAE